MSFKTGLLKQIDIFLSPLLVLLISKIKSIENRSLKKEIASILIIRPGGIGDAVLLIPVIEALKHGCKDAQIDILAEKRNGKIFSFCSVRHVYLYDKPRDIFRLIKNEYDVVIDTEQWHRLSAVMAALIKAPVSIGYGSNERKKLFVHSIPYSHDDHELTSFFNLLKPLNIKNNFSTIHPFLTIPSSATYMTKQLLETASGKKIITLFSGGSIREKKWGRDNFRSTAEKLIECGYAILIVGGVEDEADGVAIAAGLPAVINLCGKLSILETAAVLQFVELIITGDSGIMHIAYGLGKKIVALFGPGNVNKWAPKNNNAVIITKNLACSPCSKFGYTPRCRNNRACMQQITVHEVYKKAVELLER